MRGKTKKGKPSATRTRAVTTAFTQKMGIQIATKMKTAMRMRAISMTRMGIIIIIMKMTPPPIITIAIRNTMTAKMSNSCLAVDVDGDSDPMSSRATNPSASRMRSVASSTALPNDRRALISRDPLRRLLGNNGVEVEELEEEKEEKKGK